MQTVPIIEQLRIATRKGNRLATAIGAILGTVVPVMVYAVTHHLPNLSFTDPAFYVLAVMGIGGCFFSLKSVIQWGQLAFNNDKAKAVSFAVLLEGMLVMSGMVSKLSWLGWAALAYLCMINAVSSGCSIAMQSKEWTSEKRRTSPKKTKK